MMAGRKACIFQSVGFWEKSESHSLLTVVAVANRCERRVSKGG